MRHPLLSLFIPLLLVTSSHADFEAMRQRAQAAASKNGSTQNRPRDTMGKRALTASLQGAREGNANAQFSLGGIYCQGIVVTRDYAKAIEWFTKAAEQGHTKACYNLGHLYFNGRGTTVDYDKAFQWFSRAANDGDAKAQLYMASMHYDGKGTEQNYEKAFRWYKQLAEQCYPEAEYMLGHMYELGLGTPANEEMARFYLERSSKQSYGKAQFDLATLYLQNDPPMAEDARKLMQSAYLNGMGEAKDVIERYGWELIEP